MKYNQLYKELRKAGCLLTLHSAEHDEWFNPANGKKIRIPRHGSHEVKTGLLRKIYKTLLER
ncbi:MAG: type II toxin-antitoxin system HicA family toxin [Prevotella sp.]|nr:type II toxin-antitoxin system HicA family toxin [Prevotella sp.]